MKTKPLIFSSMLLGLASPAALAVNWVQIIGTEAPSTKPSHKVFGWLQPEWQYTEGTAKSTGDWAGQRAFSNTIRPTHKESSQVNLFRARLGMRGRFHEHVNYLLVTEFGNGVITESENKPIVLLDASLTTDWLGAKLRIGQFKPPASEEAQQAKFEYANFALPSAMLVMESFFDGSGLIKPTQDANLRNGTVDAFRDIGLQLFDSHRHDDWEHTWAFMLSNGNGLMRGDNDSHKDIHLYWSSENIFSGKGRKQQGLKLFAWYRDGKRTLTTSDAGTYNRTRKGTGLTFSHDKWSSTLEFIDANGMISSGTDGGAVPGSLNNAGTSVATFNIKPEARANGWWGDIAYRVRENLDLRVRYDKTHRDTELPTQIDFTNLTLGVNWHYGKNSKVIVNYEFRDFEAPKQAANHPINLSARDMDDRMAIQLFHFFTL